MDNWERKLYNKLTSSDEWGDNAELEHQLFGDDEWSGVRKAETIERLKNKSEADSWGWK